MRISIGLMVALGAACTRPAPDSCGPVQPCTVGSGSYQFCGDGSSCYYRAAGGLRFSCTTCGDCAAAAAVLQGWCAGKPSSTGGTAGTTSTTGGTTTGGTTSTTGGTTTGGTTSTTGGTTTGGTTGGTAGTTSTTGGTTTGGTTTGGTTGGTVTGPACDVVLQDCVDPGTPKCSVIDLGTTTPSPVPRCVPLSGSLGDDQPCTRSAFGRDDCARGFLCGSFGRATGDRHCRRLCHHDGDCTSPARCALLENNDGVCVKPCTVFGTDCPSGLNCADIYDDVDSTQQTPDAFGACRSIGVSTTACNFNSDCAADLACTVGITGNVCTPLCDSTHACTTGVPLPVCNPAGLPNGGGTCFSL
jgi:hypothetical protein